MVSVSARARLNPNFHEPLLRDHETFLLGGEREGISETVLSSVDEIIKIPMTGFVPSFNLQAPLSAVAIEAQRQRYG